MNRRRSQATAPSTSTDHDDGASIDGAVNVPQPVPATMGWKPDPFRRFDARYWDGTAWTERVLDRGAHLVADPEPDADPARCLPREADIVVPPPPPSGRYDSVPPPPPPSPGRRDGAYRPGKHRMSGW